MKVYLNEVQGTADAIVTLFMSKRSWTREKEDRIREVVEYCTRRNGFAIPVKLDEIYDATQATYVSEFDHYMEKLLRYGRKHITMLKFIDFSITVEGLHRAGQDDWDAHAVRFNNRIVRASTRLATFEGDEVSEWYQDKILTFDQVLERFDIKVPDELQTNDGVEYVRATNGYIRADLKDDADVKRGLYHMSIPSNFIFKVNLAEFAHVYKLRNKDSGANPEVKILCEAIADELEKANMWFTRDLFMEIEN